MCLKSIILYEKVESEKKWNFEKSKLKNIFLIECYCFSTLHTFYL